MSNKEEELSFEWEERKKDVPFYHHIIAGCSAGLVEHLIMFPFDNIKTHIQVQNDMNFLQIVKHIYRQGGLLGFYRGISVLASGCLPAHAFYFSAYEFSKRYFGLVDEELHPTQFAIVGILATCGHDSIMTPADVLKQRKQICRLPVRQIFTNMIRYEGKFSLYRSLMVTLLSNSPNAAILVSSNETLKVLAKKLNIVKQHNFISYLTCAGLAGMVSSALTTPLDVIKTKLQTQDLFSKVWKKRDDCDKKHCNFCEQKQQIYQEKLELKSRIMEKRFRRRLFGDLSTPYQSKQQFYKQNLQLKYNSIFSTAKIILKEEGIRGFFRGISARILITSPSTAISWASYEQIKNLLKKINSQY